MFHIFRCQGNENQNYFETPFVSVGSAILYSHYENQNGGSSEKNGIDLSQDPAIVLLGIYSKVSSSYHKNTCLTLLIAPETGNNPEVPQLKNG